MKPIHVGRPTRLLLRLSVIGMTLAVLAPARGAQIGASVKLPSVDASPQLAALQPLPDKFQIAGNLGNRAIEIDDLDNNPLTTLDANMESDGTIGCSGDGSPNPQCPFIADKEYIDWNDLAPAPEGKWVANDGTGNTDDSFGGTSSKSCLQPDHAAPQKEDILRIYLANNDKYFYFGEVDKSPNGNSRHVFLLHQNPVQYDPDVNCAGDGNDLYIQLTEKDKLIKVLFEPSASEPTSQLFKIATSADLSGLRLMDDAVNYDDGTLWDEVTSPQAANGIANFAVNNSAITDDLAGGVSVPAQTFGEGAVSLEDLGIDSPCGTVYHISIVTRSSGAGSGESKDYVGILYDFGDLTVEGSLTPSCDQGFGFSANASDTSGNQITDNNAFSWSCNYGALTFDNMTGWKGAEPGVYTCNVTATVDSCSATYDAGSVNVYAPVGAEADLVPSCTQDTSYSGTGKYGSGDYKYAWQFTGCSSADSTSQNGTATIPGDVGSCTGNLTVTDLRDDLPDECTDTASDEVSLSLLSATANLTGTCALTFDYSSEVSGNIGGGDPTYAWTFTGQPEISPSTSDNASGTASVEAPGGEYTGSLTVTDNRTDGSEKSIGSFLCTAPASDSAEVYGPISVSIATDNTSLGCPLTSTAVMYTASASGGKGTLSYFWNATGDNILGACGDSTTCTVDSEPSNYCALISIDVTVEDESDMCDAAKSSTETVTKTTSVESTNPP